MRIRFTGQPQVTNGNPCGQIGLKSIRVVGVPLGYLEGQEHAHPGQPITCEPNKVDKVLAEMGLPLMSAAAQAEAVLDVDPDTMRHIRSLHPDDVKNRDRFILLGRQIKDLQRQLAEDQATTRQLESVKIRNEIKKLELKRNTLGAFCEDLEFEGMVMLNVDVEEQKRQNLENLRLAEAD